MFSASPASWLTRPHNRRSSSISPATAHISASSSRLEPSPLRDAPPTSSEVLFTVCQKRHDWAPLFVGVDRLGKQPRLSATGRGVGGGRVDPQARRREYSARSGWWVTPLDADWICSGSRC